MGNAISKELRSMARENGLCDKWFKEWDDDTTDEELFDKYKRGIDFSIDHEWITNDFIKSHWSKELLHRNGIFVDDKDVAVESLNTTVIVNGDSDITLSYALYDFADIYVRHTSKVKVIARQGAKIFVNIYDEAEVTVDKDDTSKVYIYNNKKE
jgi:hypothetical protein